MHMLLRSVLVGGLQGHHANYNNNNNNNNVNLYIVRNLKCAECASMRKEDCLKMTFENLKGEINATMPTMPTMPETYIKETAADDA